MSDCGPQGLHDNNFFAETQLNCFDEQMQTQLNCLFPKRHKSSSPMHKFNHDRSSHVMEIKKFKQLKV